MDSRLKDTKCAKCMHGRMLFLDDVSFTFCADCKDRPNRAKDKSRYEADVESDWLKKMLDDDAHSGSPLDF
jgi:hypothetical protein